MSTYGPDSPPQDDGDRWVVREYQKAELMIRALREGVMNGNREFAEAGCQCGNCDVERALARGHETIMHLDRAVRELEAAFDLLGIERV